MLVVIEHKNRLAVCLFYQLIHDLHFSLVNQLNCAVFIVDRAACDLQELIRQDRRAPGVDVSVCEWKKRVLLQLPVLRHCRFW